MQTSLPRFYFYSGAFDCSEWILHHNSFRLFALIILTAGSCSFASAQTWSGLGPDANWSTSANWVGGSVPVSGNTTDLIFNDPSGQNTSLQNLGSPMVLNSLQVNASNGGFVFDGQPLLFSGTGAQLRAINSTQNVVFNNDITLDTSLYFYEIVHNGVLNVSAAADATGIDLTLNGTTNVFGRLDFGGNGSIVNGVINGTGELNVGALRGTGTINCPINSFASFGSTGTLTVNGDLLIIGNKSIQSGIVEINGTTNWHASLPGTLNVVAGTRLTGTGVLNVVNGTLGVSGEIAESQQIILGGSGVLTRLNLGDTGVILSDIEMKSVGRIAGTGNSRVDGDISVAAGQNAQIGLGSAESIALNGLVQVDGHLNFAGDVHGAGTINGSVGSIVNFSYATVANSMTLNLLGSVALIESTINTDILIDDGTLNFVYDFNPLHKSVVNGNVIIGDLGTLSGTGILNGNILVAGELSPGNSAGTLDIDGSIDLTNTTNVCIEIGGTLPGDRYDQILGMGAANSSAMLDGLLDVQFIESFMPGELDEFFIFDNMAISGRFDNTPGNRVQTNLGLFKILYGNDFVKIYHINAIPEPGSAILLLGSMVLAGCRRRRLGTGRERS